MGLPAWSHRRVQTGVSTLRRLGPENLIASYPSPQRDRVAALILQRIIHPRSKLACARQISLVTGTSTLAQELALADLSEDDLYAAMDWLLPRQE